jgi:hypothetical protein
MKKRKTPEPLLHVGWREWVALPALDVSAIKAKVDTGARSSSLHAFGLREFERDGRQMLSFTIHPLQRQSRVTVTAEAELLEYRHVRSSSGHHSRRPVILTPVELFGQRWNIELTLASRDEMGFRMLLGRQAVRGRFLVDPARSYLAGQPEGARKRKKK